MIIVDNELKKRESESKPVMVGLVGAGFMGQGIVNQIQNSVPGMKVAAIFNRRVERARNIYDYAGAEDITEEKSIGSFNDSIDAGKAVITDDISLLTGSEKIDILLDVTGSVEFGARMALDAFESGKDVVLMNAELDATLGPILQTYAEKNGVILSACDGDEPGVQMNLVRWVKGLGLTPRVVGNIKGLQDPYRNPTTQQEWAERWGQNPAMVTSFADGSKISFEQTIVANATGFKTQARGMSRGKKYEGDIMNIGSIYDYEKVKDMGGVIDYVVGTPHTKVFCLAEHPDPKQQHYLKLYKMGDGPLYPFFVPYHLVHFEVPNSIARVSILRDNVAKPIGGPVVEVCAVAKRDLKEGEVLDDYGMYMTYGEAVNADEMSSKRYLPEGLVEGCTLKTSIKKDQVITYDDVTLPKGRIADQLRCEQYEHFRNEDWIKGYMQT